MADPPLLEVRSVGKYFGSVIALKDISMAVNAGLPAVIGCKNSTAT